MTRIEPSPPLDGGPSLTLQSWRKPPPGEASGARPDSSIDCGWGRLIFAHTFTDLARLADLLEAEGSGKRDIAFYVRDPHVLLSLAPNELFLDPSHTYRYWLGTQPRAFQDRDEPIRIRRIESRRDAEAIRSIYTARGMVRPSAEFLWSRRESGVLHHFVAVNMASGNVMGTVLGIDHVTVFGDPENGASLWCLAVHPDAELPGVGQALTQAVLACFSALGRSFVDLSVLHDNSEAIRLYEKMGWKRVPVFCVKRKNAHNRSLYVAEQHERLNPYAAIIVREARRRGISVDVLDASWGLMELGFGGRQVRCRESLSELTSGVAFHLCDDKRLTNRTLKDAGLPVPHQIEAVDPEGIRVFCSEHEAVVVKPARGEQGAGVAVGLCNEDEVNQAIEQARKSCPDVVIEEMCEGADLRLVVIDYRLVAAALRRQPEITGTGHHTVEQLIRKLSRRRESATSGESHIPLDAETVRTLRRQGYELQSVLAAGKTLEVRKTANLHTGGTLHDVTDTIHPALAKLGERAARVLKIPVVGLDLCVPDLRRSDCTIIEANERVGLANHEPRPTAERFLDLLFPETASIRPEATGFGRSE